MLTVHASDLQQWVVQWLWPLTRILGFVAVAPLFSHPAVPNRIKLAIGFVLTLAVMPALQVPTIEVFSYQALLSLLAQFLIGISMGFVMRLLFAAVEMAGFMTGMSMGLGFASFYDPQSEGQSVAIGQFLVMFCLLIFLSIDGHLLMVASLIHSFEVMPILNGTWHLNSQGLALLGSQLFQQGLMLSLPVIASLLITNMALGVLTKAAPQLNIFGIGFPITISVGLIMVMLSLSTLVDPMSRWMLQAPQSMLTVLKAH